MLDKNMARETIILDLLTGDAHGLRNAKFIQNWNSQAFAAPRTELKELLAKPEMDSPGIYILHGKNDKDEPVAYIGVGKSVRKRLSNRKEEYWTQAIVFVGAGGSLHEGSIKFLEGRLIEEARKIGEFKVINEQGSGSPLPDYERAAMEGFLIKMQILLPVLGCNVLVPKAQVSKKEALVCNIKGLLAYGNRSQEGFVVFKGSEAVLKPRKYAAQTRNWTFLQREKLLKSGILVPESDRLRFTQDYQFASPSAAAAIVRGGNASGLTSWRNSEGKKLRDIDAAI